MKLSIFNRWYIIEAENYYDVSFGGDLKMTKVIYKHKKKPKFKTKLYDGWVAKYIEID